MVAVCFKSYISKAGGVPVLNIPLWLILWLVVWLVVRLIFERASPHITRLSFILDTVVLFLSLLHTSREHDPFHSISRCTAHLMELRDDLVS
jgi:hypothetical protein